MKYTNNGLIGGVTNYDSSTAGGNYKSGNWDIQDVYEGRTRNDEHKGGKNLLVENNSWISADEDPNYEATHIHLPEPPEWHLARDWSTNQHDEYLILDASVRSTPPTFFGPRYQHWSAIYGETGYLKLNENNSQLQFGTGAFTIEFWLKRLRNDSTAHFIMGFGNTAGISGGTGFSIYITADNKIAFSNASTGTIISGAATLGIDEWIHAAFVRSSTATNDFKIYVNGILDATGTCGNFHPTNSTSFYIGRDRVATASTFFGGQLTDIRITKSAVYTGNFTKPTQALDMTIANVVYHDSVKNPRFYTDNANSPSLIPVTIEAAPLVKIIDSPFFTETTKTPQAHGTHSGFTVRQNYLKYLDIQPNNTSLKLGTSAFTVEGWIYTGQINAIHGICGKGNTNNGWHLYIDASNKLRWLGLTGTDLYNTGTITNNFVGYGGWYHVAAVREGTGANQFKLYVNGKLDFTGTNADNYFGTDPLYILSQRDATNMLYGFACGIRISKVARYTSNFDVSTTAFIDNSMSVDSNVSILTLTCGNYKLMPTQANYIDYGKARVPQIFRTNEVKYGQHHPTSSTGWSWGTPVQNSRVLIKSNAEAITWTRVGTNTYQSIDCGTRHTMAVGTDGTLWGWGINEYGQLGTGDQLTRSYPVKVSADSNWKIVSCGYGHSAGVKTDGTLWAWGFNNYGQLGQNDTAIRLRPTQIGTDNDWVDVRCIQHWDRSATIAKKSNGTLWACGRNDWSLFGNGTSTNSSVLVPAGGGADIAATALTATENNNRYIITSVGTTDWTALGASSNTLYVVFTKTGGTGAGTGIAKLAPNYTQYFVGRESIFGIRSGGTLWAWGNNYNGRYGVGNATWQGSPINVGQNSGASTYIHAAAGRDYHMAVRSDGTLWAAGWGGYGQTGVNDGNEKQTWTQVGSATNWTKVWAGWYTTWALNNIGQLYTMGRGHLGETGDGLQSNWWAPVLTGGGIDWTQTNDPVKGGECHMALLGTNGGAYVSGFNTFEQLGLNQESAFNWGTGDFSLEFWLQPIYDIGGQAVNGLYATYIFNARALTTDIVNGDEYTWAIRYNSNFNTVDINLGNTTVLADDIGKSTLNRPSWVHYCWQRVNGSMCLYGNGKKLSEIYFPYKIRALGNFITVLNDSIPYLNYNSGFLGAIADIRVNRGTAAYASGNINPETIQVPTSKLTPITGTVFLTANSPIMEDTSGQTQYYNSLLAGSLQTIDYNPVNADVYVLSQGPYTNNEIAEANTFTLVKPRGDTWDATNLSEGRGYFYAASGQYPEYAWITRMVKPWTIEFWFYGHFSYTYTGQISNIRKLYTATSGGQNGWEIQLGRDSTGSITRGEKWGSICFRLWTAHNSGDQVFSSTTSRWYRPHGWNHVAVVFDPSSNDQKMALFLNGYRVGSRSTALTGGTKNWCTYYLYNDGVGISGYRISDIARYNPNNTTYQVPYDGYTVDNNCVSVVNAEAPYFTSKTSVSQLTYGVIPSYKNKKLGRGSWRFNSLNDQGTGLIDRFYFHRNSWTYNTLDIRQRDITLECWAQWWDHAAAVLEFDGTCGIRLPNSATLNNTNGVVEFWIKAPFLQSENPVIMDATTNNTGSYIGIGGLNSATPGRLIFTVRQGTCSPIYSKTVLTDSQWHHVVCCHYQQSATRSTGAIFIDGKLEAKSYTWTGSSWYFQDGQIGWSRFNTGTSTGYSFSGKLANLHYYTTQTKYISTWNKFSKTPFEPFVPNYWNPAMSDIDSTQTTSTNIDYESGKLPIPKMPNPRTTATVLLLNAENITVEQSPVGTVGSITGTGPWTATITGMTSTTGLAVGTPLSSADNRTGALFGGTPTSVVVASVVSASSITYTVTGGTTPVAGTIANIRVPGQTKEDSANNFTLSAVNSKFPVRTTNDRPWSTYTSQQEAASRPLKVQEIMYGGTLFNVNGAPHVFRTEDGTWAFSHSSDFTYDHIYPRRIPTLRTNIRAKCSSDGDNEFDHIVLQRSNQNWILWINGVEAGRMPGSWQATQDRPYQYDNIATDFTGTYIYLGTHSSVSYNRSWSGYIEDFKVTLLSKYETRVINNVPTLCHRGTNIPALPTALGPRK